jgi:hypothetical protein
MIKPSIMLDPRMLCLMPLVKRLLVLLTQASPKTMVSSSWFNQPRLGERGEPYIQAESESDHAQNKKLFGSSIH